MCWYTSENPKNWVKAGAEAPTVRVLTARMKLDDRAPRQQAFVQRFFTDIHLLYMSPCTKTQHL
jgi:hypothetical protein